MKRREYLAALCKGLGAYPDTVLEITPRLLADALLAAGAVERDSARYYPSDLAVTCPKCFAPVGEDCRTRPGMPGTWLPGAHKERQHAGAVWAAEKAAENI
jgi:hypothetical protein